MRARKTLAKNTSLGSVDQLPPDQLSLGQNGEGV